MTTIYGHYIGKPVLESTLVNNWRIWLEQTFTAHICIWIRENMLEFSSAALPTLFPYHKTENK